jgi:RNA polymerase-interacting CarD/CdnL/TRCF family regulator
VCFFDVISCSKENIITVNQGDHIHHPDHGIGKVQSIRERSFSGEEHTKFAKLFFKRENLTWLVRANELPENIRSPLNASEARKLIKHLKTCKSKFSPQWKVRANANQAVIDKGDPFGYAEVCKGLSVMQQEGSLSATDRKHLSRSIEFLSEELANALGKTQDEARLDIEKATLSQK